MPQVRTADLPHCSVSLIGKNMPWGMVSVCAKCHIAKQILISHRNVFEGTYTSLKEIFLKTLMAYYRTCSVLSRSENLSPNVII